MIASMLETFGEAFATLRKARVDPHLFLDVMNALFASPVYANYGKLVADQQFEPAAKYDAFCSMMERDASDSLAAVELVLAQPSVSSQLIDNLNASSHLRALLTDLFLFGEILRTRGKVAIPVRGE